MNTKEALTEYFEYLDALRESGDTNMFGARPYLQAEFEGLTITDARRVVKLWMNTFSDGSVSERVLEALSVNA